MRSESIADKRQRELGRMAKINVRKLKAHIATHPGLKASRMAIGVSER